MGSARRSRQDMTQLSEGDVAREALMRGTFVIVGFCAALLSVGCGHTTSPTGPSVVRPDSLSPTVSASQAGAATQTAPSHADGVVPFEGTLEGSYGTPAGEFPLIRESIVA